jgi:hypothetical protein
VACHFAFSEFGKPEVRDASWFAIHPSSAASWEGVRRLNTFKGGSDKPPQNRPLGANGFSALSEQLRRPDAPAG